MKTEQIRIRILTAIGVAFVGLLVCFIFCTQTLLQKNIQRDADATMVEFHKLFQTEMAEEEEICRLLLNSVATQPAFQSAWLARDSEALFQCAAPIFEEFRSLHRITHFYFIDTNSVCFLRVHKQEKQGDLIDRFTLAEAVRTGETTSGIEMGPLGTFTLRVVRPWWIDGQLVGYVELGGEIDHVAREIKEVLGIEFGFFLEKTHILQAGCHRGIERMRRNVDWDQFPNHVVVSSTITNVPLNVYQALTQHKRAGHSNLPFDATVGDVEYLCGFKCLIDAAGKTVGDIVVMSDITDAKVAARRAVYVATGTVVFVGAVLFGFLFLFVGKIQSRLVGNEKDLRAEMEQRSMAEDALIFETNRADEYLDLVEVMMVALDAQGIVTMINRKGCEVLGYDESEILGKNWFDHFVPERVANDVKFVSSELLKKGLDGAEFFENPILTKEGEERLIAWHNAPIRNKKGEVVGHLSAGMDITEKKASEAALQQERFRLKSILDSIPYGVYIASAQHEIEYINPVIKREFGAIDGRTCYEYFHDREESCPWCKIKEVLDGNSVRWEWSSPKNNRDYDLFDAPLTNPDGSVSKLEIFYDITERKRAETALQEREAQLRQIIDLVPHLIFVKDDTGQFEMVNKATAEVFGTTVEDLTGRRDSEFVATEEEMDHFRADDLEVIRSGKTKVIPLEPITDSENRVRYLHTTKVPFRSSSSGHAALLGIAVDITEQKAMEEQLRQAQKMESIGQLVGGVAHDFNNLLQIINGFSDIARAKMAPNHAAYASIEEIAKAGGNAKDLVQQLLAYSRQQVVDPVDLDLNIEIKKSQKMLGRLIGEHIERKWVLGENLDTIFADKGQMQQVLMNLCVNARDAMPNGGTLTVQTKNITLGPDDLNPHLLVRAGDYVQLSVRDTGCGMDKETCSRIFDPFFTTKEVGKGTGLGLSTVYGIVKQSEGHINVTSEPGEGTTFEIYFPVSQPLSAEKSPSTSTSLLPVEGGIETILVVEDAIMILELATYTLKEAGYTVLTAKDGVEAVQVFEEHADEIDLVVMDVVMPRMGGKKAMRKMLEIRPAMRHLFVSGYSLDAGHTGFIKETGEPLLEKPYEADVLLKKIRDMLDEN